MTRTLTDILTGPDSLLRTADAEIALDCFTAEEQDACEAGLLLTAERLAKQMFLYRTSTNVRLPSDFWERQSASMRAPFLSEARALLARLDPMQGTDGAGDE
jgi:hypothetical protein